MAKDAIAGELYLGIGYITNIDVLNPLHNNGSIEKYDYIAGKTTGTGLIEYETDAEIRIIGYRGILFEELSVEARDIRYNFSSDEGKPRVDLRHNNIVALAYGRQKYARSFLQYKRLYYRFYVGGGLGSIKETTENINTANKYNSQTLLAGVNFTSQISPFARSPHRFFIEYSYVSAKAKRRDVMVQDGSMRQVSGSLLTRNVTLGYSYTFF